MDRVRETASRAWSCCALITRFKGSCVFCPFRWQRRGENEAPPQLDSCAPDPNENDIFPLTFTVLAPAGHFYEKGDRIWPKKQKKPQHYQSQADSELSIHFVLFSLVIAICCSTAGDKAPFFPLHLQLHRFFWLYCFTLVMLSVFLADRLIVFNKSDSWVLTWIEIFPPYLGSVGKKTSEISPNFSPLTSCNLHNEIALSLYSIAFIIFSTIWCYYCEGIPFLWPLRSIQNHPYNVSQNILLFFTTILWQRWMHNTVLFCFFYFFSWSKGVNLTKSCLFTHPAIT